MTLHKPEYLELKFAADLMLLILLLALLALPIASLGLSGVQPGMQPQIAGSTSSR
jgi:hypothetical protein